MKFQRTLWTFYWNVHWNLSLHKKGLVIFFFFYDYGILDNRDNTLHLTRKCALIFISEKRTVFRQRTVNFKAIVFIILRNISRCRSRILKWGVNFVHLNHRNQRNQILFQYLRDRKKKKERGLRKRGVKIHPFHLPWIRAWYPLDIPHL